MTISELFIRIGVKVEGAEKLKQADASLKASATSAKNAGASLQGLPPVLEKTGKSTEKAGKQAKDAATESKGLNQQLKDMESWAARSAVKIDVLAASLLYVVDLAMKGAMALERFTLATGIAPNVLQGLQGSGVRAGISPEEMSRFVTSMQSAGAQMRMTGAGVAQWSLLSQLLGVPLFPGEDPRKLINDLHVGLMRLRNDQLPYARNIAEQAGIAENIFQAFRNPQFSAAGFQKMFDITQKNLGDMNALNAAWGTLKFNVSTTTGALISEFTPTLRILVGVLERVVDWFARFVQWLDRGSIGANAVKVIIVALGIALGVTAVAFTGLTAVMGTMSIAAGILDTALLPLLGTLGLIGGAAAAAAIAVGALVLIQQDLDAQDKGGKGLIPQKYRAPTRFGLGAVKTAAGLTLGAVNPGLGALITGGKSGGFSDMFRGIADFFRNPAAGAGASSNTTVHQQVAITVPAAAGREGVAAQTIRDYLINYSNQAAYGAQAPHR